jgi:CDP-glucose 4,6-dehydratase
MESLVDGLRSTYSGKRIVVTGHNGFKGSWLVGILNYLGADVDGISLPINNCSPFQDFHLKGPHRSHEIDIRDLASLSGLIGHLKPELVFHFAAQSLVLDSYVNPRETFETNVMGTVNLLHSLIPGTYRGIITTTTDKVYMNDESGTKFKESDVLWGHDPYSLSKTGTELVVSAWRNLDMGNNAKFVTVRAGNVIGAGDFSENRLLPDLLRGISQKRMVEIRNPESVRPWQYVLDPLVGYLLIGSKIFSGDYIDNSYNFGPPDESFISVLEFVHKLNLITPIEYTVNFKRVGREASVLKLDSSLALADLGWVPVTELEQALNFCVQLNQEALSVDKVTSHINCYFGSAKYSDVTGAL